MEVFVSESKRAEYEIKLKVQDSDALYAVLGILTQMQRDTLVGHGSMYIADAEGDERTEHYIDGDGAAGISDLRLKRPDGNWQNVEPTDYLKRGKYEFVRGTKLDGTNLQLIRDGEKTRYKGSDYFIYYSGDYIYLYASELSDKKEVHEIKPEHHIAWKEYSSKHRDSRDKMFKRLD